MIESIVITPGTATAGLPALRVYTPPVPKMPKGAAESPSLPRPDLACERVRRIMAQVESLIARANHVRRGMPEESRS